ncbi:MAG: hypothetical protein AB7F59_13175 [Bdellovibrionales bacterium]
MIMNNEILLYLFLAVGGTAFIVYRKLTMKEKRCPKCNEVLPKYRVPARVKEVLWGGWTCQKCGTPIEVDFFGNIKTQHNSK